MEKQPAFKSYFFGKGYSDIGKVMQLAWGKSFSPIVNEAKRLGTLYKSNVFIAIIMTLCDCVVFPIIAACILVCSSVFSILFFIAFVLIAIGIYISYSLAYLSDLLFCLFHGINSHCPRCQEKFRYPSYKCPKCGVVHSQLRPSKYGILFRRCQCGNKIPTTFFNGRQKLQAVCLKCGAQLKDGGKHVEITIPVVGGKSSGKTCYISSAITQLGIAANRNGLEFSYSPSMFGDDYSINKERLNKGLLPDKTNDDRLMYYQFYLTPKGDKIKNLISVCDVAGESYESYESIGGQIGYKYANAFLMVIDPFSISKFREEMVHKLDLSKYKVSDKPMDEILDTLISLLENLKCLNSRNMLKTDVAVVFTKCDIPGLEEKIGETAVRKYMQLKNIASRYDVINQLCEDFLKEYEEENFLNGIKSKFKSVQFFACSALGHLPNGMKFAPEGVDEPLLWLIDKVSPAINLKDKWGRKI